MSSKTRRLTFPLVLLAAVAAACSAKIRDYTSGAGGNPVTATSSASSASGGGAGEGGGEVASVGVTTSSGTGMPHNSGDCATDADCPGSKCVEVTPGGFRVCLDPPPEATKCNGGTDQCCDSSGCKPPNRCYLAPKPCGGVVMLPHNECIADQCQTDADCKAITNATSICVAPGVFGHPVRSCVVALCRLDTDCVEAPGGSCAPVSDPCCGNISMACVYPGGCRKNDDCKGGYCVIQGSRAQCTDKPPGCPL